LLADRERLVEAPGEHQPMRERRQSLRTLRGGRLRRHELDHALERGEGGVGPSAFVQVATEAVVEARRAQRVALLDQIDRSLRELDRAWRRTRLAGQLGCRGAELGEVGLQELGRVRHGLPQRERPLDVRECFCQAEDALRLACGFDRGGRRLGAAARRRPVGRELRRLCGCAARELVGEPRVQLLALAGQDGRVDRLRQQGVAEAEAAGRLGGDQDAVRDGLAQRPAQVALWQRGHGAEQR
jgi:hypothetical protein